MISVIKTRVARLALASVFGLGLLGCAQKNVHAVVPVKAAPVAMDAQRPMTAAPDTDAMPPLQALSEPPPAPEDSAPPPPAAILAAKPPALRKPAGEQQTSELPAELPHPPAPQISPQLSAGDQAALKRKTGEDASIAEKNLQQVNGRQLSASQQDSVAKIRGFLGQSQDAGSGGDWARAQNLAQKARLLSVELVNSL